MPGVRDLVDGTRQFAFCILHVLVCMCLCEFLPEAKTKLVFVYSKYKLL